MTRSRKCCADSRTGNPKAATPHARQTRLTAASEALGGQGGLGDLLGGLTTGGILSGGLGDLLKTFQQNGHGDKADTWVQPGPNAPIERDQLSEALGPDVLDELAAKTGLSREDILERLTRDLPTAVDDLTPDGKVPSEDDDFLRSASALSTDRT